MRGIDTAMFSAAMGWGMRYRYALMLVSEISPHQLRREISGLTRSNSSTNECYEYGQEKLGVHFCEPLEHVFKLSMKANNGLAACHSLSQTQNSVTE